MDTFYPQKAVGSNTVSKQLATCFKSFKFKHQHHPMLYKCGKKYIIHMRYLKYL